MNTLKVQVIAYQVWGPPHSFVQLQGHSVGILY